MKKRFLTPIAAVVVAGLTVFGCASSNDSRQATAYGTPQTTTTTAETQDDNTTTVMETETETVSNTDTGTTYDTETDVNTQVQGTPTDRMSNTDVSTMDTDLFSDIDDTQQYTIMDLARMDENFSTFVQLIEQAGLTASLEQMDGPMTLFLPTNQAFEELPQERYQFLTDAQNATELVRILQAHVMSSEMMSAQFTGRQVIETSQGNQIPVYTEGGPTTAATTTTIGGATVIRPDIEASNGVIHVINGIIIPEDEQGNSIMDR